MPSQTELDQPSDEQPSQYPAPSAPSESHQLTPVFPSKNGKADVAAFRRSRYEELDHTDLLHVIEELEGSRNWTSLREKLWIALIIHMLIAWYLFYGPKYIYHVRVVDPSVVMKQRQKDLTFLDLPPNLRKQPPPKPTHVLSDQNRVAQTPHPTIDRKTLEQLEAMRRAGEPKPVPAPPVQQQQAQPAPAPPQPQVAQQRAPSPPAQPLPQNNQARLEAPPAAPQPNFGRSPANPNEQMQQDMRNAMHGQLGGDGGLNMPAEHPGEQGAVQVLSDTMGWDYGPYLQRVIADTKRAWYPIIPEEARPPLDKQGKVLIRFKILPDGTVTDMQLEGPSGDVSLDRSAWGGITGASPFPPIPKAFKGPYLELRFYFLYNITPGDE